MQIRVVAVGGLKEKYWRVALEEYQKRLKSTLKLEIIEMPEERIKENPTPAEIKRVIKKEGERILKNLPSSSYVIPLDSQGHMLSSGELADKISRLALRGHSQLTFIIGGSYGLDQAVLDGGDFVWSFSPLTFPHQLMRVMLAEQIYRALAIIQGTKYHK